MNGLFYNIFLTKNNLKFFLSTIVFFDTGLIWQINKDVSIDRFLLKLGIFLLKNLLIMIEQYLSFADIAIQKHGRKA